MMDINDYKGIVASNLSKRAVLEQLAEEGAELTKAALKLIRASGNGNPTPIDYDDAVHNLEEELGDVYMVTDLLGIDARECMDESKWERWAKRILAKDGDE